MNKNLPLIIGLALPIVFIIVISAILFIPKANLNPEHNFIYTNNDYNYYNGVYKNNLSVVGNTIIANTLPNQNIDTAYPNKYQPVVLKDYPPIYLYDIKAAASHEITFEEAAKLSLDPGPSSVDGYSVNYEYGNDGIFELFGSNSNRNGYFLSKGSAKKKLEGISSDRYYSGHFKLLGWVK